MSQHGIDYLVEFDRGIVVKSESLRKLMKDISVLMDLPIPHELRALKIDKVKINISLETNERSFLYFVNYYNSKLSASKELLALRGYELKGKVCSCIASTDWYNNFGRARTSSLRQQLSAQQKSL